MSNKNTNKVSVVISSSNDFRIFDCIKSIDYSVEIVATITPNELMEKRLKKLGVKIVTHKKGNEGLKNNKGIGLASNDKVILVDSDCIFGRNAIENLVKGLDKFDACKAKLIYRFKKGGVVSKCIAEARDYVNSIPILAYTPGLALNKGRFIRKLGDKLFREDVFWSADSEFSYRLHNLGYSFGYIKSSKIYHPPISLKHDLKGAYLIGVGKRRAVDLGARYGDENIIPTLKRIISGESIKDRLDIFKKKGLLTLFYMSIWDIFYNTGNMLRRLRWSDKIEKFIWRTFGVN